MNTTKKTDKNIWANRFQEIIQTCQVELKKTTQIGMKMLSASHSNERLHESYEELGMLVANAIKNNELHWENEQVKKLLEQIWVHKEKLSTFEEDVHSLKKQEA